MVNVKIFYSHSLSFNQYVHIGYKSYLSHSPLRGLYLVHVLAITTRIPNTNNINIMIILSPYRILSIYVQMDYIYQNHHHIGYT